MKVLFICVENSCRSQIAEAFAKQLGLDAHSAGVKADSGVNPNAIKVMMDVGLDISQQQSKAIEYESLSEYDAIISMCSVKTADFCPSTFIGTQANWNITDPKGHSLEVFRQVRDEINGKVQELAKSKVAK